MSEAAFWIAYGFAFVAMLVLGFAIGKKLWLICMIVAAATSAILAAMAIGSGVNPFDPWMGIALIFDFGMSFFAAAAAVYIVKFVRA